MMRPVPPPARPLPMYFLAVGLVVVTPAGPARVCHAADWVPLFNGQSLEGWRESTPGSAWQVRSGCLTAEGPAGHLYYEGNGDKGRFRNFDLLVEARMEPCADSGVFFHTAYEQAGVPSKGYELQINNLVDCEEAPREPSQTGSLTGVRNIYGRFVREHEWFRLRLCVVGNRIRIWLNGYPTVDYVQPELVYRAPSWSGRVLSSGAIALQGPVGGQVSFRRVDIRPLPDDADPTETPRASDAGYGLTENVMDRVAAHGFPVIDYHIHLRGGMTCEKAMDRQAVTGINVGVLENIGRGWPIETDLQLREFLKGTTGRPAFVGLQVNDRDWMNEHSSDLLKQLDFVLADTMIMPMPDDGGPPVKLWMPELYTIEDPEAWMERYVRHNLRVLAEPITILANPTYLPPPVAELYDQLWTDDRMSQVIQAAVDNHVALEINAASGLPRERFIVLAKQKGAKFTFGTNNTNDRPIDMSRCFESIRRYQLRISDMVVPRRQP